MDQIGTPNYEFEGFCLDTTQQTLVNPAGETIHLASRAFATLRYLVERSGETVEKSVLMDEIWPRTIVAENNLNQCILKLRKVLGESAGERRFILTVPGRGFKFVARVRALPRDQHWPGRQTTTPAPSRHATDAELPPGNRKRWRRPIWVAGTVLAVSVVAWVAIWSRLVVRQPVTSPADYQPLTDVADSATAPVLSPDGRMLAFIRNGSWMLGTGQIWLKQLPEGDYVRLTNASGLLFAPAFTPDGARITYTVVDKRLESWDTWTVPVTGGEPTELLPNASGLTYIGPHEVMFSEFKTGVHLGIVTATDDRANHRDIYWPAHERGMAHFSYLSPDRRSVLIVEMDGTGSFQRCRLVPLSGKSSGFAVGPPGSCRAAAWSTDGAWMFFSASIDGHSHLWRQRFPSGKPQQITFGPTEEETVFATPDGRSLLTSIGTQQDVLWLHDAAGARALTTEGNAFSPWLSTDARRIYFLAASNAAADVKLTRLDIATGSRAIVLPEFNVAEYDVDPEEHQVVFTTLRDGVSQVWLTPLDRHAPPKLLVRGGDQAKFGGGKVLFRSLGRQANFLHRIDVDGRNETRILSYPILNLQSVSPDGRFVSVDKATAGGHAGAWLISPQAHTEHLIGTGWFPSNWSRDGKLLYIEIGLPEHPSTPGRTLAVQVDAGGAPAEPIVPVAAGAQIISQPESALSVGQDPSVYAFVKSEVRRNIYRIPLH